MWSPIVILLAVSSVGIATHPVNPNNLVAEASDSLDLVAEKAIARANGHENGRQVNKESQKTEAEVSAGGLLEVKGQLATGECNFVNGAAGKVADLSTLQAALEARDSKPEKKQCLHDEVKGHERLNAAMIVVGPDSELQQAELTELVKVNECFKKADIDNSGLLENGHHSEWNLLVAQSTGKGEDDCLPLGTVPEDLIPFGGHDGKIDITELYAASGMLKLFAGDDSELQQTEKAMLTITENLFRGQTPELDHFELYAMLATAMSYSGKADGSAKADGTQNQDIFAGHDSLDLDEFGVFMAKVAGKPSFLNTHSTLECAKMIDFLHALDAGYWPKDGKCGEDASQSRGSLLESGILPEADKNGIMVKGTMEPLLAVPSSM